MSFRVDGETGSVNGSKRGDVAVYPAWTGEIPFLVVWHFLAVCNLRLGWPMFRHRSNCGVGPGRRLLTFPFCGFFVQFVAKKKTCFLLLLLVITASNSV